MADRLSQYSMMPNFNQSMLQPHQMQQQNSQQPHQDNHQAMPPFSEQSHLWNQMQHLQSQFRPNNGADVNSPQINQQMADLLRSQNMAARAHGQQQQSFPLGVQMGAGPSGGASQQPSFHDPSGQRQSIGFPNLVGGTGLQAPLSQNSMQARNAMMQAITNNQNHNRQLELIGMAANQQNQNSMSFGSRLNTQQQPHHQQQHQPVNQPGQNDIFAPAMANDAMRRASPANPPSQMGARPHQFTMGPNGIRPALSPDVQSRIMALRTMISNGENTLRSLQNNRAGMPDTTFIAQVKTQQGDIAKAKEMLARVLQIANNNMQQIALANGGHNPAQPWLTPANQPSSFVNGQPSHQPQQSNLQPSPSQHHSQPAAPSHPMIIPPSRSVSASQQPPSQTPMGGGQFAFGTNNAAGSGQPGIPNGMPNSFGPAHPPPLEKTRFEGAYMNYLNSKGLNRDVRAVATIENRPVDIHALHTHVMQEGGAAKVAQKDLWATIAARLGYVQFPGSETEPARSGPATAHQLEQIYKDHLAHFDMVYVTTVLDSRRKQQANMAAQQLANPVKPINGPQMQVVMAYADLSSAELRAKGLQEHVIQFIENHRAQIQRTAAEQNLFRGNLRGAPANQPVQPPSEGMGGAANNRQFTATPTQNPAGPSNPLGHAATSPPQFMPNPAMQNGATDGGMMEHRPHLPPPNVIIPQFMRGNQEQLTRISNMLSQVKQEFLANRMATLGSVRVLPEERIAYNNVVEQLHRTTADLENKLPMLYLFANGKNDVWVKRLAVIVVTVQQQRNFLASANPRFIVNLDNLRLMLSEIQKGHERFNAMVQTIIAQQYQQQQQQQQQHQQQQPPPPPPGGGVVNGPSTPNMGMPSRPMVPQQPNVIHPSQQVHQPPPQHHLNVPPTINRPPTAAPSTPSMPMKKKPIQPISSSPAGVIAASPTPPPAPAASTPTPNASTPSATHAIIASSPKSPKVKAPSKPVKPTKQRRISKASSTPTIEPAQPPNPPPTNGVKRPREEETPGLAATGGASGSGVVATPPSGPSMSAANEPSPPKKVKTEWEGPPNDALKRREEAVENIKTEEDASQFLEQMTELIKMAGEGQESTLSSDISETLDMILKGYSAPDGGEGTSISSLGEGSSTGGRPPTPSIPGADEFVEFFDFSLFETEALDDDEGSKAPTPDLVSSSSTNPSPESGSEADLAHHALTFSDFKTEEPSDPLRLGTFKEVDGGESAYYQSTEWKWDGPMTTLDQPWAIFTSSS